MRSRKGSTMVINGLEYVMGCPCNYGRKMEDWLIHDGRAIAEYLNDRAKQLRKNADNIEVKP